MTTESPVLTQRPPESATPSPRPPLTGAPAGQARPLAVTFGNLELRPDELQALVAGARVGLTVREFQVLAVLADREDRVVRRPEIYRQVWGGEMKHRDRAVDVFVRKVRTKLAAAAPDWAYIHTHFGIGYRFAAEPAAPEE
jgi:DNA-binding response OmpR family regulator